MILSVTLNPSVDISYRLETFRLNDVNRVSSVIKTAGGKGLNVTRVAYLLHAPVLATGILGGTLGSFIENQLNSDGIQHDFLRIQQESRNCIAVLHGKQQTEILESGPTISPEEAAGFLRHYTALLKRAQVVTISGSVPNGIDGSIYCNMIEIASEYRVPVLLDCSGSALKSVLEFEGAKPALIKPNLDELRQLLHVEENYHDIDAIQTALLQPLFRGIEWVVVSMGAVGAVVKHHQQFFQARIPKVAVVNPVGSGDATIAGLAIGFLRKKSEKDLIRTGMAAGILNAMEKQTGFVDSSKFDAIFAQVEVTKVRG